MKKYKDILIASIVVGLSSLLYIDFYIENFKFSFAGVMFPLLLFIYDEFNPILFGALSGFSLVFFRGVFYGVFQGDFVGNILYAIPENIFYIVYGGFLFYIKKKFKPITHNKMFIIAVISDTLANIIEIYIRIGSSLFTSNYEIIKVLLLVGLLRASLVWLMIMGYKYYKLFLIKEEHDKRYKNLLRLTSQLKTEVYWMEKNMTHIEKVMSNAYELFSNINENKNRGQWEAVALEIAKDVHEIKKEYGMVVMGIEDIMANRLDNTGMYFSDLMVILKETLERDIKKQGKNISMEYLLGKNFYTEKHYYLMSILRNIGMNAIDSIENKGNITISHITENNKHKFIVEDDGCGISDEDLPHIFSPGYSTKIDYNTGQINRGLGLTLIEKLLEIHLKGNIQIESEVTRGSTFIISIPVKELEGINE